MPDDAVCRVIGGVLWHRRFERAAHFHAPEDAEDPILIPPLHPLQVGPDGFLFADPLLWIQHRDLVVSSVAFHPSPVLRRALCQDLRRDRIYPVHVAEKMHDVFGPGQQRQVPLDDDAVETVIYKNQEAFKKLREGFHRSPPLMFGWIPKSSDLATGGIKYPDLWSDSLTLGFQGRSPWLFLVHKILLLTYCLALPSSLTARF